MTSPGPSVIKYDSDSAMKGWWGIHYDDRGIERERRVFPSRDRARIWVRAMKAKERGDLREKVA